MVIAYKHSRKAIFLAEKCMKEGYSRIALSIAKRFYQKYHNPPVRLASQSKNPLEEASPSEPEYSSTCCDVFTAASCLRGAAASTGCPASTSRAAIASLTGNRQTVPVDSGSTISAASIRRSSRLMSWLAARESRRTRCMMSRIAFLGWPMRWSAINCFGRFFKSHLSKRNEIGGHLQFRGLECRGRKCSRLRPLP